ncbi:MAG: site-specific integrase [Bacteroidaceae bacterium]|nr:site-specific integrase [Bacteroidaceae bacterium]
MKRIIIEIPNEQLLGDCEEIIIVVTNKPSKEHGTACFLVPFFESLIDDLERRGHHRTAETYRSTLNSFMAFRNRQDILLSDIDKTIIEDYESHLQTKGLIKNSTSFYNRILRTVYNRAVEAGLIEDCHPFRHVYTGIDKTVKRAITLDQIRALIAYQPKSASGRLAKNLFVFSLFTRGMSFVDMAYLKLTDVSDGYLIYRRQKSKSLIRIRWEPQMQKIADYYADGSNIYLLPILSKSTDKDPRTVIASCQRKVNRNLKAIAKAIGLDVNLTMYVARHSWASVAKQLGAPLSVISDGMGHSSERITRIYLKELDTSAIDNTTRQVIVALTDKK